MKVQHKSTAQPVMIDGEWRSPKVDDDAVLQFKADNTTKDAYNRVRITGTSQILEIQFPYGVQSKNMGQVVAGNGTVTHSAANRSLSLNVFGTSGDSARSASHRCTHSYVDRSGHPVVTFQTGAQHANNRYEARVISTNEAYGFGIREQGSVISLVIFHPNIPGGELVIPSTSWNVRKASDLGITTLSDTFHTIHGTGAGFGGFFTAFHLDGKLIHEIVGKPSPFHFPSFDWRLDGKATNTGTGIAGSMLIKGISFSSEADAQPYLSAFAETRPSPLSVGTTEVPLIAIRPSDAINGIDNPLAIYPFSVTAIIESAQQAVTISCYYQQGGASPLTGANFQRPPNATYEVDVAATAFTKNANTTFIEGGGTGNVRIDLTKVFSQEGRLALRKRFGEAPPTNQEMLIVTGKVAASTNTMNVVVTGGQQAEE